MKIVSLYSGTRKRRAERMRTLMPARAFYPGAERPLDCTVRNISATGAKVLIPATGVLPGEFDLHVPEMQLTVRVAVAWRQSVYVGVRFIGAPHSTQP